MLPLKIIQKIYIKIRHQKDYTDGTEYETKNPEVGSCLCIHFCKSARSTQKNRQSAMNSAGNRKRTNTT